MVGIDIAVVNVAPVAVVGDPIEFEIGEGSEVDITLDGSESYDANSEDTMTCEWTQIEGPDVSIEDPAALSTRFTATEAGDYAFALTCSDGELAVIRDADGHREGSETSGGGPTRPPVAPDEGCSATGATTWLLFGLVALRRRRR